MPTGLMHRRANKTAKAQVMKMDQCHWQSANALYNSTDGHRHFIQLRQPAWNCPEFWNWPSAQDKKVKKGWLRCTYKKGQTSDHCHHRTQVRMWSSRVSPVAGGNAHGTATLEDRLVSYQTENTLTMEASNHAPWYLPKGAENHLHKNLHTDVYSRFIHNCQPCQPGGNPNVLQ